MKSTTKKTKEIVLISMFAAIIIILAFTPIGFIQLGFIKATIIHVPVIIGAVLLGPRAGAALGFLFGAASMISNTFSPSLLSFAFSPAIPIPGSDQGNILAIVVCFVPRILVGIIPWYIYKMMIKLLKKKMESLCLIAAGLSGAFVNTLLVMHLIYFLFQEAFSAAKGIPKDMVYHAVLSVIFLNGIPEAILAGILTFAVCRPLIKYYPL